ncbi:hypothetical protein OPV22_001631 [Ensete ventricosum]|uniref:Uncharacterized protein n=1 Tax=Ensete ventricosum TaxID=4639 RepID=A0AAV8RQJ9_ENSVE|nr:hypothetical protein OPV22_001631 [Ensete ventricosum]
MIRAPSVMVPEMAAEHLKQRQSDWARHETPSMPLRLWIFGYVLQCVLHMVCVCVDIPAKVASRGCCVDVEVGGAWAQIHRGRWKNLMMMSRTKTLIGLGRCI